MPWKVATTMSQKEEFIRLATNEGANLSELCRIYDISRTTAYKWLERYRSGQGLEEISRRPNNSPNQTAPEVEALLVDLRIKHPSWGPRKLRRRLSDQGYMNLPAPSTIASILKRECLIDESESIKHKAFKRFEMEEPNQLWQMDFKGYFPLEEGGFCHPLVVIDDHARFLVGLKACANEQNLTVKEKLISIFRNYGMPERMLMDNGNPWGNYKEQSRHTEFTVWLMQLGIRISHGRPRHPQTQGKTERFNRTLDNEVINRYKLINLGSCQIEFDNWRKIYNNERPHEALGLDTPSSRYRRSNREYPEKLPTIIYDDMAVRKVDKAGKISFKNRVFHIGKAFRDKVLGLQPSETDGIINIYFDTNHIASINLLDI